MRLETNQKCERGRQWTLFENPLVHIRESRQIESGWHVPDPALIPSNNDWVNVCGMAQYLFSFSHEKHDWDSILSRSTFGRMY